MYVRTIKSLDDYYTILTLDVYHNHDFDNRNLDDDDVDNRNLDEDVIDNSNLDDKIPIPLLLIAKEFSPPH